MLHDLLRLAPEPRNAHLYACFLLQLAFYATAVALAARQTRQPWLVAGAAFRSRGPGILQYLAAGWPRVQQPKRPRLSAPKRF